MIAAKLPPEARDPEPRRITSMVPGESGFVLFNALLVTKDGDCFLHEKAPLLSGEGPFSIRIRRDADGFHVVLPPDRKYSPGDAAYGEPGKDSIPVTSVTIARKQTEAERHAAKGRDVLTWDPEKEPGINEEDAEA